MSARGAGTQMKSGGRASAQAMYRTLSNSSDSAAAASPASEQPEPEPGALELSVEAPTTPDVGDATLALTGRRISQRSRMDSNVRRAGRRWRRSTQGDKDVEAPRWFERFPFSRLDEPKVYVPIYTILCLAIPLKFASFVMEELALDDPHDPDGCVQIRSAQVKGLYAVGMAAFAIVWPIWFDSLRQVVRVESAEASAADATTQSTDSGRERASSEQASLRDSAGSVDGLRAGDAVEHMLEVRKMAQSFALAHKIRCGDISKKDAAKRRDGVSPSSPRGSRDSASTEGEDDAAVMPGALCLLRKSGEGTTTMIKPKEHNSLLTYTLLMVLLCVMFCAVFLAVGYSLLVLVLTGFHEREGTFRGFDQFVLSQFQPNEGCYSNLTLQIYTILLLMIWVPAGLITSFVMPAWLLSLQLGVTLAADDVDDILQRLGPIDEETTREIFKEEFRDHASWTSKVQRPVAMLVETMRHLSDWGPAMGATVVGCWLFAFSLIPTAVAEGSFHYLLLIFIGGVPFQVAWG